MAKHIVREIEKDYFEQWRAGALSLRQLRDFNDRVVDLLDERLQLFSEQAGKAPKELEGIHQRLNQLSQTFNSVGFLAQHLTGKRKELFLDIATQHQELYIVRTLLEGQKFAGNLIPFIKEQLITLRSSIDTLDKQIAEATERINLERNTRLGGSDTPYQMRIFDVEAIDGILRAMKTDEDGQRSRTQQVRRAIIDQAGNDVNEFKKLHESVPLGALISLLSRESAMIVEREHIELSKTMPAVIGVNIVEQLQKQYEANPSKMKAFVKSLYDEAGCMLTFNKIENDRAGGDRGGTSGRQQTVGVFLPECESQREFRGALEAQLIEHGTGSGTKVKVGRLTNEIIIMTVSSLMPVRFVDDLPELKRHYDGLLKDRNESFLLHGQGDGKQLPPLFARLASEVEEQVRRRPCLLLARLLGLIKQRQSKTTGLDEWVFIYLVDGLPTAKVLEGRSWGEVLGQDQVVEVQRVIEKEVKSLINNDYKHIDKKIELFGAYQKMAQGIFSEHGEDDQHPEYLAIAAMRPVLRDIIGIPAADN